jgi:xanthine dehydrogenase accessory factor
MDHLDFLATAQRLQQQGLPFALVSVLRVQPPASARPGDKAVVTADGIVHGWIGGGCAQPAVLRTVRQALADGCARVIRIAPKTDDPAEHPAANTAADPAADPRGEPADGDGAAAGHGVRARIDDALEFGMACHSGGTLELFIDPLLPRARLVVVGDTPLAEALAALAPRVGLPVTVLAPGADATRFPDAERVLVQDVEAAQPIAPGAFVVVATQGRRDVPGLRAALALQARRVFFVASARKAQVLKAALVEAGADPAAVAAIVAPAGQAIGAQTPEEIALSVLAAVVAARREAPAAAAHAATPAPGRAASGPSPAAPACGGAGTARSPSAATPPRPGSAAGAPSDCCAIAAAATTGAATVAGATAATASLADARRVPATGPARADGERPGASCCAGG